MWASGDRDVRAEAMWDMMQREILIEAGAARGGRADGGQRSPRATRNSSDPAGKSDGQVRRWMVEGRASSRARGGLEPPRNLRRVWWEIRRKGKAENGAAAGVVGAGSRE
jgi:hypothetical protein